MAEKLTQEQMDLEMRQLELEAKRLELIDLQERVDERKMKRDNKAQRSRINGDTLRQTQNADARVQAACNHRKGGNGAEGIVHGKGDDPQYAVLKHQFGNGDIWVRCLRCGKTWKPPIKDSYYFDKDGVVVAVKDGKFNQEAFEKAQRDYNEAVAFQTRNVMSGSIRYGFSDGGAYFRKVMENTTLR